MFTERATNYMIITSCTEKTKRNGSIFTYIDIIDSGMSSFELIVQNTHLQRKKLS
uniref:Uncharacterized protein n=1 Tax=Octopus bimaculoides TaxID=37653 RepID=A0A0L8HKB1_OCTBM